MAQPYDPYKNQPTPPSKYPPYVQPGGNNPFNPYGRRAYGEPEPPKPVVVVPPAAPKPTTPAPAPYAPPLYPPSGGGGGGGGGGGAPTPPDPFQYGGLPTQYVKGLASFVGDVPTFYGTRGTEKQAQADYYAMLNAWQNRAGVALTPDDWANVWAGLNAYRTGYGQPNRTWTFSDALGYLGRMLQRAPETPYVSYLQTGEI